MRRLRWAVAAALLLTALAVSVVTVRERGGAETPQRGRDLDERAPGLTAAETFGVLRTPSPVAVPPRVRRFISAMDARLRAVARPNPALARAAVPRGGDPRRPWFLVPGANAVCLVIGDGTGACQPLDAARRNRLQILQTSSPASAVGQNRGAGPLSASLPPVNVVRGAMADGIEMVRGRTADGRTVTATVRDNVYELAGRGLTIDVVPYR
ncbi:hypothetical protein [Patulibacter defluvii]|uniref:hypothetical protein n=1 Tax=Patulibacter defluvii TaxID=3095358 RepID=UPI002A7508BE|nr:hypothetical protein [Patulibacter sp. DM4]